MHGLQCSSKLLRHQREISRPDISPKPILPTPIPFLVRPDIEDFVLLQSALSEELPKNATTIFIKRAASLLAPDVCFPALLHSCLALAFRFLTSFQSLERSNFHEHKAAEHLASITGNPEGILEADVFGALLLAQLSFMDNRPGSETLTHMNQCISMLEKRAMHTTSISEGLLQHFDLLVFDLVDSVEPLTALRWICSLDRLAFGRQSTFKRRVEFFRNIPSGGFPEEYSAVLHTLAFVLRSFIAIIREFCSGSPLLNEIREWVGYGIEDIKRQAQDPQFLRALDTFSESDTFNKLGVDDLFPIQCMACIRLLVSCFDFPTVLESFAAPVAERAALIVTYYRSFRKSRKQVEPVFETSNITFQDILISSGIFLNASEAPCRIFLRISMLIESMYMVDYGVE